MATSDEIVTSGTHDLEKVAPVGGGVPVRAVIVSGYNSGEHDTFTLREALSFVKRNWWRLAAGLVLGAALGIGASHLFRRVYRAEVLTMPVSPLSGQTSILSSIARQYGSLGSAVGLNLGAAADTLTTKAIAILQSHEFLEQFIRQMNLMPVLFPKDRELPASKRHTMQDAYRLFTRNVLLVKQDSLTSLVTVQVDWYNRFQAAQWANELVKRVNYVTQQDAIAEANRSLAFLRSEYESADYVSLKQATSSLIEAQLNKKMLADTRPEYALQVLDPAQVPDARHPVSPRRILFLAAGGILGVLLALAWLASRPRVGR